MMNLLYDRTFAIAAAVFTLPFLVTLGYNGISDPLASQRAWLSGELAQVDARGEIQTSALSSAWQQSIAGKPSAWMSITKEPPPPEPPKPEAPTPPNLKEMLGEIIVSKAQIGDKIRVMTPQAPRGEWLIVGATINGCTLAKFDRESATFTHEWKEGGKTLSITLPRQ